MWESISGFVHHAAGPFKLLLSPTGNLIVKSSNDFVIWNTIASGVNVTEPFKMTVENEGRIVITDNENVEVWESWPVNNNSFASTYFTPLEYRYVPCDGKDLKRLSELNKTNKTLLESERLVSANGVWDLRIVKDSLAIHKLNVMQSSDHLRKTLGLGMKQVIDKLSLSSLGEIKLWFKNKVVYKSEVKAEVSEKPFKMVLDRADGSIRVLNKKGENILERKRREEQNRKIELSEEESGFWAMNCEFYGDDVLKVGGQGHLCSKKCQETKECTHYTWSPDNGGECFLKRASNKVMGVHSEMTHFETSYFFSNVLIIQMEQQLVDTN